MDACHFQTKENKNKIKIIYMYVKFIPFAEQLSYLLFQNMGYYNAAVDFWTQLLSNLCMLKISIFTKNKIKLLYSL